ncbi:hypothetical protein Mapa_001518 [Marchantia paleacea]|nr:hypothetical protein Mapa_001518 [Marchantia paleacea]
MTNSLIDFRTSTSREYKGTKGKHSLDCMIIQYTIIQFRAKFLSDRPADISHMGGKHRKNNKFWP